MASSLKTLIFFCLATSVFISTSTAQTCTSYTFSQNRLFSSCNSLPQLSASIHWNYTPNNGSVHIAYRASISSNEWVAWGINPTSSTMVGSQVLVAFQASNGTFIAYPTQLTNYTPPLVSESLSFAVSDVSAEQANGVATIFATIVLPGNGTTVNQVWQAGPVSSGKPGQHSLATANLNSHSSLNLLTGASVSSGGNSRLRRKNIHGVLNAISWGTLMPIGAIIARYVKVFPSAHPAWFYLHIACQCSGYIVGVAGWGTGLKLGSESAGIEYHSHRNIGITLFCLATLQVFALLLRPNKDNKYRLYWNIYHHSVGYTVIILSVVNIFKGFDILDPEKKWKHAYIGIIIALGAIALILEAITWPIVIKRRRSGEEKSHHGVNVANGYGGGRA
ncbi:hypothetical protein QJS10_CPB17g02048 [Acorus calamus]|uniref:Cytochrome b561 and DOMON domain-containing protein n=1 Tax=Acorus calamus TaxID=4465 RepID=A0AAV9CVI3_ACOCL|nr:hypothetical protein QJS10_CPB17g02048 [Acorus calamus]